MASHHHVAGAMNLHLSAKAEVPNQQAVIGTILIGCGRRERGGDAVHGKHVVGGVA
jgi:hypothetical protein